MEMPIFRPIPIKTKGLHFFKKIYVWLKESRKWELYKDWTYSTFIDGRKVTIFIKKGFVTDGASVPKLFRSLYSPTGIFLIAGLIHDYAYRFQRIDVIDPYDNTQLLSIYLNRSKSDKIFKDINIEVNECIVSANIGYYLLCIFGSFAWDANRKIQILCNGDEEKLNGHI